MYNVVLDENKFYTGNYAKIGKLKNGIDIETLPPEENSLCYYIKEVETPIEKQVEVYVYYKIIYSDTEFYNIYYIKLEDGTKGEVISSIEYDSLPDEEKINIIIESVPKQTVVKISSEEYDSLPDEEKSQYTKTYKVDENGLQVFETITEIILVKQWEFSEDKFNELNNKELEYLKIEKISEMSKQCEDIIYKGISVLIEGKEKQFSLTITDQINLQNCYNKILAGDTSVTYHANGEMYKEYDADIFKTIYENSISFITQNTVLFNHLREFINSCNNKDQIINVKFTTDSLSDELKTSYLSLV